MPQIRMLENVWQGSTLLAAGSDVTVTTELADQLVGAGKALDTTGYKGALVDQTMTDDVQRAKAAAVVGAGTPSYGRKAPSPVIGGAGLAASDFTALSGTVTLETGPNGQPAIKIVTGVGTNAEVSFPGLVGAVFGGEAYVVMHGSRTQGNVDYAALYVSQLDTSYTNGVSQVMQYGLTNPLQSYLEQGGANTYWFRKGAHTNIGTPTYPMPIGQMRLRIVPLAGTAATVYIYAVGVANPRPKGRICIITDDGYDTFFKLGLESFVSRSIPVTCAVIGSAIDTGGLYATKRQLQNLLDVGGACVAHGPWPNQGAGNLYTAYPGAADPVAAAVADMRQNRDWLRSNGLLVPGADRCYVWPQGQFQASANDATLLAAARTAGFTLGRGTSQVVPTGVYTRGVQFDASSAYNRLCLPIIGHTWAGTTAAEAINIGNITTGIANVAAAGGDAFLMLHRVQPSSTADGSMSSIGIRVSDLETIAAALKTEIDAGRLECPTMPQMAMSYGWWGQF